MTFQLRVLPSPRSSGQIAMDSWCHQRTMLKLRACASAVPEFERSQIASLSSFSAEVATAFVDVFLALQLCLTSRISSQQFNAHTFLEKGTSFQVKRGMQRVQDQRQMPAGQKQFHQGLLVVLECTGEQHTSPQSS